MENNNAAQKAIEKLNKYILDGKELRVEFSRRSSYSSRVSRESGRFGGVRR
jgi:RNA recognition motif-containing protein